LTTTSIDKFQTKSLNTSGPSTHILLSLTSNDPSDQIDPSTAKVPAISCSKKRGCTLLRVIAWF